MRAIEVTEHGDASVLQETERDRPTPESNEVLIEVAAAGINFADIQQRMGIYPGGPSPPFIPGFEVAGTIVETGADSSLEPGTMVASICPGGGYAEYTVAEAGSVFPIPPALSAAEAVAIPVQFLTAHGCLFDRGGLGAGERVLIHAAAGGVGSAAVQLAANADAEVFGTASSEEKLEHARGLGCDHPINYEVQSFADVINDITGGDGIDLIIDGVGGDTFRESLDCLAHFGRIVTMGASTGEPARPNTAKLLVNNQQVIGFHLGNTLARNPERALTPLDELLSSLADGELEVVIGGRVDLDEAGSAHSFIEDRSSRGKIILEP